MDALKMPESAESPNVRLSIHQWIAIMGALIGALGGVAGVTGHSLFSSGVSPEVGSMRDTVNKIQEKQIEDQLTIKDLRDRVRELEHQQGYDNSGDSGYFRPKNK